MALAAVRTAMNLSEKAVHPFFARTQRVHSPTREDVDSRAPKSPRAVFNEPSVGLAVDCTGPTGTAGPDEAARKRRQRKGEANTVSGSTKQAVLEQFTRDAPQLRQKPSTVPDQRQTQDASLRNVATSLEEDPNSTRRKRRRTSPPETQTHGPDWGNILGRVDESEGLPPNDELAWHEQLQAEADKHADIIQIRASSPGGSVHDTQVNSNEAVPGTPLRQPMDSSLRVYDGIANAMGSSHVGSTAPLGSSPLQSLAPQNGNPSSNDRQHSADDGLTAHMGKALKKISPAKKMLRLNSAGRFSSPPSNHPAERQNGSLEQTTPKKRGRKRKVKRLLVVLKYGIGISDRAVGQAIQDILASEATHVPKVDEPQQRVVKPISPPKPTHPFFMGKEALKSLEKSKAAQQQGEGSDAEAVSKRTADRKTAITPGKLRAQAKASHAQLDPCGFGKSSFGSTQVKTIKYPGMHEAAWPRKGTAHVRGLESNVGGLSALLPSSSDIGRVSYTRRKFKNYVQTISEDEDLLLKVSRQLHVHSEVEKASRNFHDTLRIPERLVVAGAEIQNIVRRKLHNSLPKPKSHQQKDEGSEDGLSSDCACHPALVNMYMGISESLTPFDKGQCETQAWTQKYVPMSASEVLQAGKEAQILRDWLKRLTVMTVEGSGKDATKTVPIKGPMGKATPVRRKRKKREELDGFIVSSDDEAAEMDELATPENHVFDDTQHAQKRSVVRVGDQALSSGAKSGKLTNAVLLSGPHGCGKTAAVYAVAKELGFEVFEINSGSRRSGKDILDRVGDMTENHLVQQQTNSVTVISNADDTPAEVSDALQRDLETGRQGTMKSFFKPVVQQHTSKLNPRPKPKTILTEPNKNVIARPPRQQKQSLILLEEVDVLFEEDKQFWMTVLTLATHSKRPIIMTCNDENLVPLNALSLHAILRFSPPPAILVTDYLLLLAATEGHLLDRDTLYTLYEAKGHDLRASITELNFWCQMAVGDRKGGLEWMLDRWPPGCDIDEQGRKLRVASKGTYQAGMGWLGRDIFFSSDHVGFDKEHEFLKELWDSWGIDIRDQASGEADLEPTTISEVTSAIDNLAALTDLDVSFDVISAADIYCSVGLPTGDRDPIDTTQPPLPEKSRLSFVEGYPLLQAEAVVDYAEMDTHLAISTHLQNYHYLSSSSSPHRSFLHSIIEPTERNLIKTIINHETLKRTHHRITRTDFSRAFDPISETSSNSLAHANPSNQLTASTFDRSFSIITTDLAPYVRSIVAFDLRLEAERLRLSNLLTGGGKGAKRVRTTRASRSALEGGKRETTRRERWFEKSLNLALVMATGGREWAGMTGREADERTEMGSVRSQEETQ